LLLLYTGILKQAARSLELLGREIGAWHVGGTPQLCIETRWCCSFPTQIGSNSPQPKSSPLPSDWTLQFIFSTSPCTSRIIRAHLLSIWVQMPLEWSARRATDRDCSCCLQFPLSSISPVFFLIFSFFLSCRLTCAPTSFVWLHFI